MISIIIVNYNRKDLLRKCLDSVRGQGFRDVEVIVVDNASIDGSAEMARAYYPEVRLVCNTRNLLFCKAYNRGIDSSKGNFVLCLNNDVVLDKDYLKEALLAIGLDKRIGMVSGKTFRMDMETIDSTGLFLGRNRKAVERGYGKKDRGQYEESGYVFGVSGACAFFRRNMLLDIKDENGYFDEGFGMYYEDLDLCWRAQKKGWKAYYSPTAIAYHARGATAVSAKCRPEAGASCSWAPPPGVDPPTHRTPLPLVSYVSWELKKMYIRNRYRCMRKNDSLWGILINLLFILPYEIKIWGYLALERVLGAHRRKPFFNF